jgi:hypothetical protein
MECLGDEGQATNDASPDSENQTLLDGNNTENTDEEEVNKPGWGKKIANFLKVLILGAGMFCYDMTSRLN